MLISLWFVEGKLMAVRCVGCSKCKAKFDSEESAVGECRKCLSMVK